MRKKKSEQGGTPVPLAAAVPAAAPDRLVDGVPVRTYRGTSLAALAPTIRAELGENAMILRQREGVTGGIGGFFAKRMVEIDVAIMPGPSTPHIDTTDGPSVGPGRAAAAPQPTQTFDALQPPQPTQTFAALQPPGPVPEESFAPPRLDDPQSAPVLQPTVPFSAIAEQHGLAEAQAESRGSSPAVDDFGSFPADPVQATAVPAPQTAPAPHFSIGTPSAAEAASVAAALAASREHQAESHPPVPRTPAREVLAAPQAVESDTTAQPEPSFIAQPPAAMPTAPVVPVLADDPTDHEPSFDPGRRGAEPAPVAQSNQSFEDRVRDAGLTDSAAGDDPVAQLGRLHGQLLRRGLPDQIASPVVDDTLLHRVALQPDRPARELLASELARRIPTAPLAGRAGQAVAFVGSSGAGKTRAIARLAAAYGAAARVPVACVTLQDSGHDGLLATSLAPFGIAVHAAPDAPRALDRITALRRTCLVLIDTPGVSPGDVGAVDALGATLELLELDQVALCLPVVLAAPIARRVLRAMRPLGPSLLVATHADEADLLGGVVAVAIDRRVPLAYVSAGAGRGGIVGADAHHIAAELLAGRPPAAARPSPMPSTASSGRRAIAPVDRSTEPAPGANESAAPEDHRAGSPSIDIAAGAAHLAVPWIMSSPRHPGRRGQ